VRAVRYVGERAYVVTFRNIDPLFAFDLSDPAAPRVAGELEIPGFSTYMHPVDERHLLTLGSDGASGMQLQLFDVGDLAQPRLLHRYALGVPAGYTSSMAASDPHAFTYYAPRGLLAVPLSIWSYDAPAQSFNGIAAFHVDVSDGIRELGRIDHTDLAYQALCKAAKGDPNRPYFCDYGGYVSNGMPSRSVVMAQGDETYLYTVSAGGVKASAASTPGQGLGVLPLPVPTYEPLPLMRTQ